MKPKILCIVGESGSGKTHMSEYIKSKYDIPMIESYTDRPPRYKGETGHTFLSKKEYDKLRYEDMIAFTTFGGYRYCCLQSDVEDENTYVIDEDGLSYLLDNFSSKFTITSCRLIRPENPVDKERKQRDKEKFRLPVEFFDYHIVNNGTIEEFEEKIDKIALTVFR